MIKVDQIRVTINEGVGGSRKTILRRLVIKTIQKYMQTIHLYNKTARETIRFDIDIKVTFT